MDLEFWIRSAQQPAEPHYSRGDESANLINQAFDTWQERERILFLPSEHTEGKIEQGNQPEKTVDQLDVIRLHGTTPYHVMYTIFSFYSATMVTW